METMETLESVVQSEYQPLPTKKDVGLRQGSIRKLRQDRGYGFIAGDDGVDYFFHWTGFDRGSAKDFRGVSVYDRVEFSFIMQSDKGPRAIKIRVI